MFGIRKQGKANKHWVKKIDFLSYKKKEGWFYSFDYLMTKRALPKHLFQNFKGLYTNNYLHLLLGSPPLSISNNPHNFFRSSLCSLWWTNWRSTLANLGFWWEFGKNEKKDKMIKIDVDIRIHVISPTCNKSSQKRFRDWFILCIKMISQPL